MRSLLRFKREPTKVLSADVAAYSRFIGEDEAPSIIPLG
jgi:hypothetical protein